MKDWIAGVDEVGRGALFGPVVAAAVILDPTTQEALREAGVTDSKQLSLTRREALYPIILGQALDCRIGVGSVREIDRLNILQASLLAMRRAIHRLSPQPTLCLVDGNRAIPNLEIPQQTIIKGDQQELAIAAASIIAKVWRDRLMVRFDQQFPGYGLATNKGYGSQGHRQAMVALGVTPYHRRSFGPCRQLSLSL